MVKKIELQDRLNQVLGIVVEEHIRSGNPVGSAFIAEYHLELSPATIRNILAELEERGYLTHPHTSAGRIPTEIGYRYYVDNLMHEIQLLGEEKDRIKGEYREKVQELESVMETTSKVLSEITHYTSIISVDGWNGKLFCRGTRFVAGYPEFQDQKKIQDILSALEEKKSILELLNRRIESKIEIFIGHEMASTNMEDCSLAVSSYGKAHGPSGRIAILGPTRMDYERVVCALNYFSNLMNEIL